jgi:heme/copper-type cytochrome/quinol oxidase subunit 2
MWAMTLMMLYGAVADDKGFRGWLMVLVMLAVILILAGCIIALLTWYYQRKAQNEAQR